MRYKIKENFTHGNVNYVKGTAMDVPEALIQYFKSHNFIGDADEKRPVEPVVENAMMRQDTENAVKKIDGRKRKTDA